MRPPQPQARAHALTAEGVRSLQRSAGNVRVVRLLDRSKAVLARQPEIAPTDEEMGQRLVDNITAINDESRRSATTGVHYPVNYKKLAETDDEAQRFWTEDYKSGYANPKYWKRLGHMSWQLKAGADAAAAIKDWRTGLTIAECATVLVAIKLDTMRAAVGDDRFNAMFSSLNDRKPDRELLKLNQNPDTSSTKEFLITTEEALSGRLANQAGERTVKKGEWYGFGNHPMYELKHPAGDWQGENTVCVDDTPGQARYSGFGATALTERQMIDALAGAYNEPRDEADYKELVPRVSWVPREPAEGETWKDVWDRTDKWGEEKMYVEGAFPDTTDAEDIITAPWHTIRGIQHRGGFQTSTGLKLDAAKVARERPPVTD